jgi:uncharacterized Ntn-hydrolase superfamily protein
MRPLHPGALALALSVTVPAGWARATYSVVASDTRTREVGGAGASCVYPNQVSVIYGVAPGFGAVHAQAQSNAAGRDRAVQLLGAGQAPTDILAAITAASFDANAARRQYGVVDVLGRSAGFTGTQNMMFADDRQGTSSGYVYSVQGNILTGARVLEHAAAAFEGEGCDLADRLMRALEAGARDGEGDTRCVNPSGIAANSAFIQVDLPNGAAGSYLKLSAGSGSGMDPLPALRRSFDNWRATHPCMNRPSEDAGASSGDAGQLPFDASLASEAGPVAPPAPSRDAQASDAEIQGRDAAPSTAQDSAAEARGGSDAARPHAGSDAAETAMTARAGDASSAAGFMERDDGDGCTLSPARSPRAGLAWLALAVFALLRARSRR